jgi:hypothetical protein
VDNCARKAKTKGRVEYRKLKIENGKTKLPAKGGRYKFNGDASGKHAGARA